MIFEPETLVRWTIWILKAELGMAVVFCCALGTWLALDYLKEFAELHVVWVVAFEMERVR